MAMTINGDPVLASGVVLLSQDEDFTVEYAGGRVTFHFEGEQRSASISGSADDFTIGLRAITGGEPDAGGGGIDRVFVKYEVEWAKNYRRLTYTILDRDFSEHIEG